MIFAWKVKLLRGHLLTWTVKSICTPSVYPSAWNRTGSQKTFVKGMPDCMNKLINVAVIFKTWYLGSYRDILQTLVHRFEQNNGNGNTSKDLEESMGRLCKFWRPLVKMSKINIKKQLLNSCMWDADLELLDEPAAFLPYFISVVDSWFQL